MLKRKQEETNWFPFYTNEFFFDDKAKNEIEKCVTVCYFLFNFNSPAINKKLFVYFANVLSVL